ncbi:hypothetical protein LCGC14_1269630 [marine sediment metagenome]|uniref:Uncharacterized protein n=1 Tax=marine sediment metagenome TaxID=412755 RepID=A0A0F9L0C7_9ZZZZ
MKITHKMIKNTLKFYPEMAKQGWILWGNGDRMCMDHPTISEVLQTYGASNADDITNKDVLYGVTYKGYWDSGEEMDYAYPIFVKTTNKKALVELQKDLFSSQKTEVDRNDLLDI